MLNEQKIIATKLGLLCLAERLGKRSILAITALPRQRIWVLLPDMDGLSL